MLLLQQESTMRKAMRRRGGNAMKKKLTALLGCMLLMNAINIEIPASAQTLSSDTKQYYSEWKETYLRKNPYVKDETQYYVFYGEREYAEAHATVEVTVSEAHGYGMLIAALMADCDSEAKDIFDGMYRYYLAHPSSIGPHLMAWQQSDDGKALVDSNGADSATDGDLDIAYALLLADTLWGSSGEINYRQAAELVISDIMEYDVSHEHNILRLGDWAHDVEKNDKYYSATRASDFIMQYFPVFYEVSGDERWMQLYNNTYGIINHFVEKYQTGLLPDFIIEDSSGEWIPAPANFLENENDGVYEYNSCRVPWRISTDALVGKNADAKKYAETVNAFFVKETGGKPGKIMAGYTPDGKAVADWDDLCFTAPLMLSAAAAGDTKWHDAVRKEVLDTGVDSYFGNTIAMLCLITDDGCWLVPETAAAKPAGDVNGDGVFNTADAVLLQKWLLAVPDTQLADRNAADFSNDNKLNAADLSLMKQALLKQTAPEYVEPDERLNYFNEFTVRTDGLKLYRGPDESYEAVASVPAGTRLYEIGTQKDNDRWLFTQYDGKSGWIRIFQEDNQTMTIAFQTGFGKPVIYLYPEQETDVHVELELTGSELRTTYPKYNDGWDVTAYPDGTLVNKADGTHHRYLFWDSVNSRTRFDYSKGFCVPGSETERFLKEKLTYMGLNENEMNEFIVYWLPKLEHNAYNLISFQGDAYTNAAKLTVTPEPDSECRIFMAYVPLENPVEIEPQQLEPFERTGFALVEWGGAEILP